MNPGDDLRESLDPKGCAYHVTHTPGCRPCADAPRRPGSSSSALTTLEAAVGVIRGALLDGAFNMGDKRARPGIEPWSTALEALDVLAGAK